MKERDAYFDNLKVILIFFVVLGHFTNMNRDVQFISAINNAIYSFHMPLFVFISGYFSRNIKSFRSNEITNVLYPYLIFQLLHYLFTKVTGLGFGGLHIFTPTYQNWYLLGLLLWRIIVPYFEFVKKKYVIIIVIACSLLVGFDNQFNDFLGLYRIIFLLPIFTFGYYSYRLKDRIEKLSRHRIAFIGIFAISTVLIFLLSYNNQSFNQIFFFAYTPVYGYNHNAFDFLTRTIGIFSSCIIAFSFLFIVPAKKTFFTKLGKNTLTVFLLHMFIIWPINNILNAESRYFILYAILISSILTYLLSLNLITKLFTPFIDLKFFHKLVNRSNDEK